jgi:hypothetical protein
MLRLLTLLVTMARGLLRSRRGFLLENLALRPATLSADTEAISSSLGDLGSDFRGSATAVLVSLANFGSHQQLKMEASQVHLFDSREQWQSGRHRC